MAESSANRKKRLVKNPETFRERALKATGTTDSPKRLSRVSAGVARPLTAFFRPIGSFLKKLFSVQPFKTVALLGRWGGLIIWPVYIRNSWKELRLVAWPSWRQSRQLTFAVLAFAVVFGSAVAGV